LRDVARQLIAYLGQLKREHKLTLPETEIAVARMLTEFTQRGLNVTAGQIAGMLPSMKRQQLNRSE